jgi:hypothetical protein
MKKNAHENYRVNYPEKFSTRPWDWGGGGGKRNKGDIFYIP